MGKVYPTKASFSQYLPSMLTKVARGLQGRSPSNPPGILISAINDRGRELRHTISQYGSIPWLQQNGKFAPKVPHSPDWRASAAPDQVNKTIDI